MAAFIINQLGVNISIAPKYRKPRLVRCSKNLCARPSFSAFPLFYYFFNSFHDSFTLSTNNELIANLRIRLFVKDSCLPAGRRYSLMTTWWLSRLPRLFYRLCALPP